VKNTIEKAVATAIVTALMATGTTAQANNDGTKAAVAAAAVALGVAAVVHNKHHHKDNEHSSDAMNEADYERGYQDGVHNYHFDEHRDSRAYKDGFDAGVYDRKHRVSHYREDDDYRERHGAPGLAQRACVGEASASWDVNPRDIYPVRSKQIGGNDYLVEVASGYRHGKCEVSAEGRIYLLEDGRI